MLFHKERIRIIPIFFFHKGCKNICSFCNQKSMVADTLIKPEEIHSYIRRELKYIKNDYDIEIAFFGGTFTNLKIEEMRLCLEPVQDFIKDGIVKGIRISTRPDCIDKQIIEYLKAYKLKTICLGIESIFEDVLKKSNRYYDMQCVDKSIDLIKNSGIKTVLQIMLGLPNDTYEKSLATLKYAISKKINGIRICPTLILKNTELEQQYFNNQYTLWDKEVFYDLMEHALIMFYIAGIPILRFGLCIDNSIRKNYIHGLYHESLGDYIEYRSVFRIIRNIIKEKKENVIYLHPDLKRYINGYKKENYKRLIFELSIKSIEFSESGINADDLLSAVMTQNIL